MAASKHKITQWYVVQLYCDKCRSVMDPGEYQDVKTGYVSTCPHCGEKIATGAIRYPRTMYEYLLKGTDCTEEENNLIEETNKQHAELWRDYE